jgi:adenylate cyclase
MTQAGFKRKLTAILSVDAVGYSRLMREDEEATVRDIAAHRVLITEIIQQHHGRVVDSPGDNILAEFASVVNGVNGAIKIQEEIKKSNADTPKDHRMEFRIGINLGDVIEEEGRIYGDGVNIAARVEGLASTGGISISGTVYEHIKDKLSLGYHYLGEQNVKNIPEPVRVYRLLPEAEDAGKMIGEEKSKSKKSRYIAFGALALIIVVVGALAIWNYYLRPSFEPASIEQMDYPLPEKPSIAVLPFSNLSSDTEHEYIADGITENIITGLSQIPEMFVIARNSVYTYKGKPVKIKQVSEELGVRYVLEGSIQKSGDRLRVTAQLIDAIGGHHLWAERYDRELKDLFALLDEITMKILTALEVQLTRGAGVRIQRTDNIEAWGHAVKGESLFYRFTKEDFLIAQEHCEKALELDPDYAGAMTLLALIHVFEVRMGWSESPPAAIKQALDLLKKASKLNDKLAGVPGTLGQIYLIQQQHDMAIAEGEKAIALDPNSADAHSFLSQALHYAGRSEEAIIHIKKAMRLSPYYPASYLMFLADSYFFVRRYDESIAANKQLIERAQRGEWPIYTPHLALAANYMILGKEEKARFHAAEVLKTNPSFSLRALQSRNPYKNPADMERLIEPLRKAGLPE